MEVGQRVHVSWFFLMVITVFVIGKLQFGGGSALADRVHLQTAESVCCQMRAVSKMWYNRSVVHFLLVLLSVLHVILMLFPFLVNTAAAHFPVPAHSSANQHLTDTLHDPCQAACS